MAIGVPSVCPSNTPERISPRSASSRGVVMRSGRGGGGRARAGFCLDAQREPRRAAVDDDTDAAAVRLAEGGDAKQVAESRAHGRTLSERRQSDKRASPGESGAGRAGRHRQRRGSGSGNPIPASRWRRTATFDIDRLVVESIHRNASGSVSVSLSVSKSASRGRSRYRRHTDPSYQSIVRRQTCPLMRAFLLLSGVGTLLLFGIPILLAPLRWARAFQWEIPEDVRLVRYFARSLGSTAVGIGAVAVYLGLQADPPREFLLVAIVSTALLADHPRRRRDRARPALDRDGGDSVLDRADRLGSCGLSGVRSSIEDSRPNEFAATRGPRLALRCRLHHPRPCRLVHARRTSCVGWPRPTPSPPAALRP